MANLTENGNSNEDAYYLQQLTITEDSDDDFSYNDIVIDQEFPTPGQADEDYETTLRIIQEANLDSQTSVRKAPQQSSNLTCRPEVVDDFVRNFLIKMGMWRTLDSFQTEWYQLRENGLLNEEDVKVVPDVYIRNQQMDNTLKQLRNDMLKYRNAAEKAKNTFVRLRKERDFHKMHHRRVVQEKDKLTDDLKRLKKHYESYEPALKQLKHKYQMAMKEKMLTRLERDRAVGQVTGLQSTLRSLEKSRDTPYLSSEGTAMTKSSLGPTQKHLNDIRDKFTMTTTSERSPRQQPEGKDIKDQPLKRHPDDTTWPADSGINPALSRHHPPTAHLTRAGGFHLTHTIHAHDLAVAGVLLHPTKPLLASVSDDSTWKLWSVPGGELIMTGDGHIDWVSTCDFHPDGTKLATGSGDTTIKLWDFAQAKCVMTLLEHTHAVWGVSWHSSGDFIASCSMDNTCKIWDLNSVRCRGTLRGHTDSVNSIEFLPYSNSLLTCSADKTVSLWDARTGLCAQTFYGHVHSINHATFNLKGDTVVSCDAYGTVTLWDVRKVAPTHCFDVGPHSANKAVFDMSGSVIAVASNDGTVKMYEIANDKTSSLCGHEDSVQTVQFDPNGEFLISASSDTTIRIWS